MSVIVFVFLVWFNICCFFFFKQKTAYEMRISDWSSDVCSSDLGFDGWPGAAGRFLHRYADGEHDAIRSPRFKGVRRRRGRVGGEPNRSDFFGGRLFHRYEGLVAPVCPADAGKRSAKRANSENQGCARSGRLYRKDGICERRLEHRNRLE